MANYTSEIRTMMEKVTTILMMYERKGFVVETVPFAITLSEWMVIKYISGHRSASISELAEAFDMDRGMITTLLSKYLKNECIIKERSIEDKRSFMIKLTERGIKLCEEMILKENEMLQFVLDEVTINEEKGILKYLSKITQLTVGKHQIEEV